MDEKYRIDFEQAMGESFSEHVCPPVPFDDASPHECCEVLWKVIGDKINPSTLSLITEEKINSLSLMFGEYFECEPPEVNKIKKAINSTLIRWPVGSLNENE